MSNHDMNERNAVFAEEAFIVDTQILLDRIMKEKNISRADLARLMGVSRARVTQVFSDDCKNFTLRLLARAMFALEEKPEITCDFHIADLRQKWEQHVLEMARSTENVVPMWDDDTDIQNCAPANDNRMIGLAKHYRMAA
ncbi:MAG: helix-turn-helix transcriptional regulator [Sphingomonas sp.]|uniref:helix-turn-helix domain-containing protein n=1 Tax=Sphingomonas sp. TaxID=28214 RepID=UPI001AC89B49|nr:helix-turn-helix transcriptional regulator [Sphingomonas sp.]MBN8808760.1 helix-turn-helix transcriptional regulator [Sphingomonas sp.]